MNKNIKSLYIHIPFCSHICFYCDFSKQLKNQELENKYIDKLLSQLDKYKDYKFETIYIGGGSPSCLELNNLDKLLNKLSNLSDNSYEFTIEANPEDINKDKVNLLAKYKVNRVSLGVQSFNNKLLKSLNRKHSKKDVYNSIRMLKEVGIDNINCDLIYGYKGTNIITLYNDLNKLISLKVKHISTYCIQIEDHTVLKNKKDFELNEYNQAYQYKYIDNILESKGYNRYEVSNFSISNYESKHNLTYWNSNQYVGLGCGASGYEENYRYTYTKSVQKYIEDNSVIEKEELSNKDKEYEYIILHLRLTKGFLINEFNNKFDTDFLVKYKDVINILKSKKLIEISNGYIRVKKDKFFILNQVLSYF